MARRRRLHKIKIHPNRYLIWAMVVMFIAAGLLLSYIYITSIIWDTENQFTDIDYWHSYKDANISLRYPAEWLIDVGPTGVGFGPKNAEDAFLVYTYSPPNDPAYDSYSKLSTTRPIVIDGMDGIRIPNQSLSPQRIAFVKTKTRLYEFRGSTPLFDDILETVRILKK